MGLAPWVHIPGSIPLDPECSRLPLGASVSSPCNEHNPRAHPIVTVKDNELCARTLMWSHLITIVVIFGQMGPGMGILGIRRVSEKVGTWKEYVCVGGRMCDHE